jgi:hypothetical protein
MSTQPIHSTGRGGEFAPSAPDCAKLVANCVQAPATLAQTPVSTLMEALYAKECRANLSTANSLRAVEVLATLASLQG